MLQFLKKVIFINLIAALVVFVLSKYVPFFYTTSLIDFLFFVTVIIWIISKLLWEGGGQIRASRYDNAKTDDVYSMVKGHDFDNEDQQSHRQNYRTGLVFFVAGLPAFITCLVLYYF